MVTMGQTRSERICFVFSHCKVFHIVYDKNCEGEAAVSIFSGGGKKPDFSQIKLCCLGCLYTAVENAL